MSTTKQLTWRATDYPAEISDAVEAILAVYRYHQGGGFLHCEIDDGNLECLPDEVPKVCPYTGKRFTAKTRERYQRCVDALWKLSLDGRYLACHIAHDGDPEEWMDDHEASTGDRLESWELLA